MKNYICTFILLCMVLLSCTHITHKDISDKEFIDLLYSQKKIYNYECDTTIFNINAVCSAKKEPKFVFFLNANCSVCIGQICEWVSQMNENNCNSHLDIIVDDKLSPYVEYYLSKLEVAKTLSIRILENKDSLYVNKNIEKTDLSGIIFLVKNNKLYHSYKMV